LVHLGFSTADGEAVRLSFNRDALTLNFIDWQEKPITMVFMDVLAFRWGQEPPSDLPRNDATYEVIDSPELARELQQNQISNATRYAHYKLCFSGCGVLDVLCTRL